MIGPLYDTCNPKFDEIRVENFFVGTYSHSLYDKKELDVDLRVPGNARKKTDWLTPYSRLIFNRKTVRSFNISKSFHLN